MSDFIERARALDKAATEGPWYAESRPVEPYELTTVYNVFHNGDTIDRDLVAEVAYDNAEFIAASRSMLPAAVEALARVRELHEPIDGFEGDPSHWECNVCSDERGPKRWPCATYQATEVDA